MKKRKFFPREDLAHRFPELEGRPLCVGQAIVYVPEPETTSGFVCDIVYSGVDVGGMDDFSNSWLPDIAPYDRYEVEWAEGAAPAPKNAPVSFALPLVRRVNYGSVAKQLVSIQPMSVPSGGIFYMDYKYGNSPVESITSGNPKKRRKKKAG